MDIKERKDKIQKEFEEKATQLKQAQQVVEQLQQALLVLQGKFQMLEELDKDKEKKK
ncbi:MAG: hypothetical protein KKC03_13135 [Bacteroidetes bacterium]|nr:hypothetical protein [Bacteroidota bacterium]